MYPQKAVVWPYLSLIIIRRYSIHIQWRQGCFVFVYYSHFGGAPGDELTGPRLSGDHGEALRFLLLGDAWCSRQASSVRVILAKRKPRSNDVTSLDFFLLCLLPSPIYFPQKSQHDGPNDPPPPLVWVQHPRCHSCGSSLTSGLGQGILLHHAFSQRHGAGGGESLGCSSLGMTCF